GDSGDLGKNVGDDFREGKITLPVVLSYRRGDKAERDFWRAAIEDSRNGEEELARAIEFLSASGAIAETVDRARDFGLLARQALEAVPAGAHRDALVEVV